MLSHNKFFQKDSKIALLLLLIVFTVYLLCPVMISYDSKYSIPLAKSILYEGNFNLDEYISNDNEQDYQIIKIHEHFLSYFPYGSSIIAVPFVYFLDLILHSSKHHIENMMVFIWQGIGLNPNVILNVTQNDTLFDLLYEKIIASCIAALCVVLFYFIARKHLEYNYAIFLSLIFAFATSLWSVASRGFWMHGPSILFLELAFLGMLYAKDKPHLSIYIGVPLSIAYIIRPTNAIALVLFSLYVLYCNKDNYQRIVKYCILTILPLLLFAALNLSIYHAFLPPYFFAERITHISPLFFEALIGNIISPARGLLIFSPIFLLSIYGIYLKIKTKTFVTLDLIIIATIFSHWMVISMYPHWWAGHSYGPRFFLDVNPFLLYFMIPVFSKISTSKSSLKYGMISVLILLLGVSFFIHLKGAVTYGVWDWNGMPLNVDENPWRIWNINDIQFFR